MSKQPGKTEGGTPRVETGFLSGKGPGQVNDGNPGHTTDHGFLQHLKNIGANSAGAHHYNEKGEFVQGSPLPAKKKVASVKPKPTFHDEKGNEL